MIMSIFGLLVLTVIVLAIVITPRNLFGQGGFKDFVIKVLAAKELADIAFKNNKKDVPDFARDIFDRFTGHGDKN